MTELPIGTVMDDSKLFVSSDRRSSFKNSFYNRRVFNGRRVDLSDFRYSDIAAMIDAMGWTPIICMDHPIYPRLVKLFYCNLEFDRDLPSVTSLVNGTSIRLTCDSLSAMLDIPNEGVGHYKSGTRESYDCQTLEALKLVFGDEKITTCSLPRVRSLPARNRLLHEIVISMFTPRGHNRDRVSRMDLFLLKKILCGERVSLPFMIIHHMIDSMSHRYHLPYGMLLSKIFVACDVNIPGNEVCKTLNEKEVYNSRTILSMGYVLPEAGWESKEAQGDDEEPMEDEEEEVAMDEEVEEKQGKEEKPDVVLMDGAWGDLSSNRPKGGSYEADDIQESLNKLSARVDTLALSLENLQCQLEQGFANLTTKLDSSIEFLNHHFWPYPPPPSPFAG